MKKLPLCLVLVACSSSPPKTTASLSSRAIGTAVSQEMGTDGGTLETTFDGVTYTLTLPKAALNAATTITLTPAKVDAIPSAHAVILEPSGTELAAPATLTVSPAPSGKVLAAFGFGQNAKTLDASLAVPLTGKAIATLSGFSTHGVGDGKEVAPFAPADFQQLQKDIEDALNETDAELAAFALGEVFRHEIEPLLVAAETNNASVVTLEAANSAFFEIASLMQQTATADAPHKVRGSETLAELLATARARLAVAAAAISDRMTSPACNDAAGEVTGLRDWLILPVRAEAVLAAAGGVGGRPRCVTTRLRVEGSHQLAPEQSEVVIDVTFEMVGPGGATEAAPALITFVPTGLSGPSDAQAPQGVAHQTFTRVTGDERPRGVSIVVNASSTEAVNSQATLLPAPPSVTFDATEGGLVVAVTPSTVSFRHDPDNSIEPDLIGTFDYTHIEGAFSIYTDSTSSITLTFTDADEENRPDPPPSTFDVHSFVTTVTGTID